MHESAYQEACNTHVVEKRTEADKKKGKTTASGRKPAYEINNLDV